MPVSGTASTLAQNPLRGKTKARPGHTPPRAPLPAPMSPMNAKATGPSDRAARFCGSRSRPHAVPRSKLVITRRCHRQGTKVRDQALQRSLLICWARSLFRVYSSLILLNLSKPPACTQECKRLVNHSRCSFPSLIECRADRDFLRKKEGRRDSALGEIIPWVDLPLGNMTIYGLMFMQMALPTRPSRSTELSRPINCRCFYSAPWPCGIWGPLRVSASDVAAGKREREREAIHCSAGVTLYGSSCSIPNRPTHTL